MLRILVGASAAALAWRWAGSILGTTRIRWFDNSERREARRSVVGHAAFSAVLTVGLVYLWAASADTSLSGTLIGFLSAVFTISLSVAVAMRLMQPSDRTPQTVDLCRARLLKRPTPPPATVLTVGADGFLIPIVSEIVPPWTGAVEAVRAVLHKRLADDLHSVYIRGSVAAGTASVGWSDIDVIAVLNVPPTEVDAEHLQADIDGLEDQLPFADGVEVLPVHIDDVRKDNGAHFLGFLLKTMSVCVAGQDLRGELPDYGIGPHCYSHATQLASDMHHFVTEVDDEETEDDVREFVGWIMRRVIRSGFELVMADEGSFTRDLAPCADAFVRHFPDHADQMREAVGLVRRRSSDASHAKRICGGLGVFIAEQAANLPTG